MESDDGDDIVTSMLLSNIDDVGNWNRYRRPIDEVNRRMVYDNDD